MTGKDRPRGGSGGGLTGATGDLTPDDIQRDFEPGEWREASDSAHQAEVTRSQVSHHHEHQPAAGTGDEPDAEGGAPDHEHREPRESRIGGDERADREEHF
jgi:hypothetical protein